MRLQYMHSIYPETKLSRASSYTSQGKRKAGGDSNTKGRDDGDMVYLHSDDDIWQASRGGSSGGTAPAAAPAVRTPSYLQARAIVQAAGDPAGSCGLLG